MVGILVRSWAAMALTLLALIALLQAFDPAPPQVLVTSAASAAMASDEGDKDGSKKSSLYSDDWPPKRFWTKSPSQQTRLIITYDQNEVDRLCGGGDPMWTTLACSDSANNTVAMPNPCTYPATDFYAQILCHEIGHLNGWPPNHGA